MTSVDLSTERQAVQGVREQLLAAADLDIRTHEVQLPSGPLIRILKAGEGDPLVLLHGSGGSADLFLPLMEQMQGRRVIAVDRPGFGLSDPADYGRDYRTAAVQVLDEIFDALDLDAVDVAGSSGGGVWSLWYALDRPERLRKLVLLGGCPALPGSQVPLPLRIVAIPGVGELINRVLTPSRSSVKKQMAAIGEGETVLQYPLQIDMMVAGGSDPIAGRATLDELRVVIRGPWGWRPESVFSSEDLARVSVPTLLIWGDRDPLGDGEVARRAATMMPDAQYEVLATGHAPWFGEAKRVSTLISDFLDQNHSREH